MSLTPAQLSTFKAAILANPTAEPMFTAGNDSGVAAYYNAANSGFIWRPDLQPYDVARAVVWADYDALTATKKQTFEALLAIGALDATVAGIRTGFATVFGNPSASLTALTAAAQKVPTRFESVFTASNVCSLYGYQVTATDVAEARKV